MFPNLKAEQARNGYTNGFIAEQLGMSRSNFETKCRNGRFKVSEAQKLCKMFGCDFSYLFAEKQVSDAGETEQRRK